MAKIFHYRKNCIGCNSCVEIDPKNWKMCSKDGKSKLIWGKENKEKEIYSREIDDIEKEDAQKASEVCPVNIIRVED